MVIQTQSKILERERMPEEWRRIIETCRVVAATVEELNEEVMEKSSGSWTEDRGERL